jgi:hypothetical protein
MNPRARHDRVESAATSRTICRTNTSRGESVSYAESRDPVYEPAEGESHLDDAGNKSKQNVKPHLRCPCCWNGLGGTVARRKWQRQVSGPLVRRCYFCNQCGAEWVVDVRVEVSDGIEWTATKTSQVRLPEPRT